MASKKRRPSGGRGKPVKKKPRIKAAPRKKPPLPRPTPESEFLGALGVRAKALVHVGLDAIERDPEAALNKLADIGQSAKALSEHLRKNPKETTKLAREFGLRSLAKFLKTQI